MENGIRKAAQVVEFLKQTNKDLGKITGMIRNGRPAVCKVCNSVSLVEKMNVSGFKLFLCSKCDFLGLYENLQSELDKYFSESKALSTYAQNVLLQAGERKAKIFAPLARKIKDAVPEALDILEIGCGAGLLLDELSLSFPNANIFGLESHTETAEIGVSRGLKVENIKFEDFNTERKFDVIVFWAVLDHIGDPKAFLKRCFNLLKHGGMLIFGNANYAGFEVMIMGEESNIFTVPHRQSFFTPKTFDILLGDIGFSSISIEGTGELDLFYVMEFLKSKDNSLTNSLALNVLTNSRIDNELNDFLKRNLLVSHITVIAHKS